MNHNCSHELKGVPAVTNKEPDDVDVERLSCVNGRNKNADLPGEHCEKFYCTCSQISRNINPGMYRVTGE